MKHQIKTVVITAAAFVIGIGFNNFAMSSVPSNLKIAVVDVNRVVNQSSDVQKLKKEQEAKTKELQKWLEIVRADIQKQSTEKGRNTLIKKYDSQLAKKQEAIRNVYQAKLQTIDKNISAKITKEAKAKKYDIVLSKGVVLYGGFDITSDITKLIK